MYTHKLKNGLTIAIDRVLHVETACVGIFSGIGSRVENSKNNGICHFLEHMVFKGTKTRSVYDISEQIELRGGYINAWTSKEKTAWYAKVMKEDIMLALDIIVDILRNSIFPEDELTKEKQVVIQEIKHSKDSPDDIIYNHFQKLCYKGSLGFEILGSEENINNFSRDDLINHIKKYYTPNNMVLSIVANVEPKEFIKQIESLFEGWGNEVSNESQQTKWSEAGFNSGKSVLVKDGLQQTQIMMGYKAPSFIDEDFYNCLITSSILGAGMSSRLFKEIREKRGLVYSIDSYLMSHKDIGNLAVSAACEREKVNEVISVVNDQFKKLASEIIDNSELEKVKKQIITMLHMSQESSYSRTERMAKSIINFGEIKPIQDIVNSVNRVNKEDVMNMANKLIGKEPAIAVLSSENGNI